MKPSTEADIGSGGEAEWQRLRRQVELAEGFWLGFIFSPSPLSSGVLRRRTERLLLGQTRLLKSILPGDPSELESVLSSLFTAESATAGCTWIEALLLDPGNGAAQPWKEAWLDLTSRMNERRDSLRRHMSGGIVLVAPPEIKPFIREAASDLWSIRALVVELPVVQENALAHAPPSLEPLMVRTAAAKAPEAQALASFTITEAERVLTKEHADATSKMDVLISKVNALLSAERTGEAVESARMARELALTSRHLTSSQQAIVLHKLAQAEKADGDIAAAEDHLEQAIKALKGHDKNHQSSILDELAAIATHRGDLNLALSKHREMLEIDRQLNTHPDGTIETALLLSYSLRKVGDTHLSLGQISSANSAYAEAVTLTRQTHITQGDTPEALRALAISLDKLGTTQQQLGNFAAAHASYAESLALIRQLRTNLGDTPKTLRDLLIALDKEGSMQKRMGNFVAANRACEETLTIARQIRTNLGDTPVTLQDLSVCLERMGATQQESGNLLAASAAYKESLALRQQIRSVLGDTPKILSSISSGLIRLGDINSNLNNLAAASAAYNESLSLMRQLRVSMGDTPDVVFGLSVALTRLGIMQVDSGDLSAARKTCEDALSLARKFHELTGGIPQSLELLAAALGNVAKLCTSLDDTDGATRALKEKEALYTPRET